MPSTSPSWSTLVNFPLAFARPRWRPPVPARRRAGCPTAPRSPCSVDQPVGAPLAGRDVELGGREATEPELTNYQDRRCPLTGAIPTTICSPSSTCRAMLSPTVSAPSMLPPAAFSASAIRAPGASVTRQRVHQAHHADPTGWWAESRAPGSGRGLPWPPCQPAASLADITGAGCSRISVKTVTSTAIAAIAAQSDSARAPGSARTLASQPRSCCVEPSGSQRGNSELGSVSASLSSASRSDGAPRLGEHRVAGAIVRRAVLFRMGRR